MPDLLNLLNLPAFTDRIRAYVCVISPNTTRHPIICLHLRARRAKWSCSP